MSTKALYRQSHSSDIEVFLNGTILKDVTKITLGNVSSNVKQDYVEYGEVYLAEESKQVECVLVFSSLHASTLFKTINHLKLKDGNIVIESQNCMLQKIEEHVSIKSGIQQTVTLLCPELKREVMQDA